MHKGAYITMSFIYTIGTLLFTMIKGYSVFVYIVLAGVLMVCIIKVFVLLQVGWHITDDVLSQVLSHGLLCHITLGNMSLMLCNVY